MTQDPQVLLDLLVLQDKSDLLGRQGIPELKDLQDPLAILGRQDHQEIRDKAATLDNLVNLDRRVQLEIPETREHPAILVLQVQLDSRDPKDCLEQMERSEHLD